MCIERTKHRSSAIGFHASSQSLNSAPLCPCLKKGRLHPSTFAFGLMKANLRSFVMDGGSGWPCHFVSAGFGSNRSI